MATSTNGMGEAREDFDDVTLTSDDGPKEEKEKVGLVIKDDQLGQEPSDAGQPGVDFRDVPLASYEEEEKGKSKIELLKEDPIVQEYSNAQRLVEDSHEVHLVQEEAKLELHSNDAIGFGFDDNREDAEKEKEKMRLDKTTQTLVEVGNHPTKRQVKNDEYEDWQYEKFLEDRFSQDVGGEVDKRTKMVENDENEDWQYGEFLEDKLSQDVGGEVDKRTKMVENDGNEDWQYEKFLQEKFSQDVGGEVDKRTEILIGNTEKQVENGEDENGDLGRWEEENMSKEEKAAWRKIFRRKREKGWSKRQI